MLLRIPRTMLSQDVCPSVRLYVTRQYYVETAKHILKHFYRRVATSHTILVFPYQTLRQYSDGVPYNRGTNNRDFRPISRFISEMIQDKAMVTMECE